MGYLKIKFKTIKDKGPLIFSFVVQLLLYVYLYWSKKILIPVGWDTVFHLQHQKIIELYGYVPFFYMHNNYELYSLTENMVLRITSISPILMEKYFPVMISMLLIYVNYDFIKKRYNNDSYNLVVLFLSLTSFNMTRLIISSHKNLLALAFAQSYLFLTFQRLGKNRDVKNYIYSIILLLLTGLTHMETFIIVNFVSSLFIIITHYFNKDRKQSVILLSSNLISILMYLLLNYNYLYNIISNHDVFNFNKLYSGSFSLSTNLQFLGNNPLFFLMILGLLYSLYEYKQHKYESYLILFLWNCTLFLLSFSPLIGVSINGWRPLLMMNIPILVTIGMRYSLNIIETYFHEDEYSSKDIYKISFVVFLLIMPTFSFIGYTDQTFRTWIPNDAFLKLNKINELYEDPIIFCIDVNLGEFTPGTVGLYANWVRSILGFETGIYFGQLDLLLEGQPTPYEDDNWNYTSQYYWNQLQSMEQDNVSIVMIDNWFPVTEYQEFIIRIQPGIYSVS